MKRILTILLAGVLALSLCACGKNDESLTSVSEKRAVVIGFEAEHEPFAFQAENGAYNGFDLAIAQEIASKLGVTLNLRVIEENNAADLLKNGNIDFLSNNQSLLSGKDHGMEASDVLFTNKIVVAVRTGMGYDSLSQLEGKTVVVVPNTVAEEAFEGKRSFYSKANVVEAENTKAALAMLNEGSADAMVADEMFVRSAVKDGASILMLDETLAEKEYSLMFRKEDDALRERVNEVLRELIADGTMQEKTIQWFGADVITLK